MRLNRAMGLLHRSDAKLIRGATIVFVFAAIAGLARIGQDAVIAWRFGTGPVVDAYYFAISLTTWPVAVALAILTCLVAPLDSVLRKTDPRSAQRLRSEALGGILVAALLSLPLAWWAMNFFATSKLGSLDGSTAAEMATGIPGLVGMVPLGIAGALLSAWFIAGSRLALTLLEAVPSLVLMALLIIVSGNVLYWGTSVGIAFQVLLMMMILRWARELPSPRFAISTSLWRGHLRGALWLSMGQILFALVPLIDALFAVRLGAGTMAALSYANRLIAGLLGLLGLALIRAGLPLLSQLYAQSSATTFNLALRWTAGAVTIGTLMALGSYFLAEAVVSMLLERGSFEGSDSEQVARLIRYGALQMPPYLGGIVLVTALASAKESHALALIAATGVLVKMLFSAILAPLHGANGLQIATAMMYSTTCIVGLAILRRKSRSHGPARQQDGSH